MGDGAALSVAPTVSDQNSFLHDCYLAACLREYVPSGANKRWPGLLSVLDCHDMLYSPNNTAIVGASLEIPLSISRFMAQSLSRDILPALAIHQSKFNGDRALVQVAGPKELEAMWHEQRGAIFPAEAIDFDLATVRKLLEEKYMEYGCRMDRATLYVVKVLDTCHNLVAVSGTLPPQITSSSAFCNWAGKLKSKYSVDLRLIYSSSSAQVADSEPVRNEAPVALRSNNTDYVSVSKLPCALLPPKVKSILEDWTKEMFVSIDSDITNNREDILQAVFLPNSNVRVRIAIPFRFPFQISKDQSFPLAEERFALGKEFEINQEGKIVSARILPVIAKNKKELNITSCSSVIERSYMRRELARIGQGLEEAPCDAVKFLEKNLEIVNILTALHEAASRHAKWRLGLGEVVEFPVLNEAKPSHRLAEWSTGRILTIGQELLTEWILSRYRDVPVLALRPSFKFNQNFDKLVEHCPWIKEEHLQDFRKRRSLAEILRLEQDYIGLELLGNAIKTAICEHKIIALDSIQDMREGDLTRFKKAHRAIAGLVGHTQVASIFFGTPRYSMKQLNSYARILNLPPEERKPFNFALCEQVQKVNQKVQNSWKALSESLSERSGR